MTSFSTFALPGMRGAARFPVDRTPEAGMSDSAAFFSQEVEA